MNNWKPYPKSIPVPNFESSWGDFARVLAEKTNGERILCSYDPMAGYFVDVNGEDIGVVNQWQYSTQTIQAKVLTNEPL